MQTRTRCVSASAPGKVILHGEHSVVYGKLALAAAIGLRTTVQIDDACADGLNIDLPDIGKTYKISGGELTRIRGDYDGPVHELDQSLLSRIRQGKDGDNNGLAAAIYLYLTQPGAEQCPGLCVTVTSKIPVGAGLGSSAAYSVALAAALSKAFYNPGKATGGADGDPLTALPKKKRKTSRTDNNNLLVSDGDISTPISVYSLDGKEEDGFETVNGHGDAGKEFSPSELSLICRRAFLAEKILHGNPSGIDNTVCTYGGLLSYDHSSGAETLKAPSGLSILLVDTRVSRNTRLLVEGVRQKKKTMPKILSSVLDAMDQVSRQSRETLGRLHQLETNNAAPSNKQEYTECLSSLGDLISVNHGLLASLGVSHPALEAVCRTFAAAGLKAKLTGAGGGGCAMALLPSQVAPGGAGGDGNVSSNQTEEVIRKLEKQGFRCWRAQLGCPGVTFNLSS